MRRTDIDAATFADYLRQMCGDGSAEWCYEPMQTSVLLDVADMLDENTKLRKLAAEMHPYAKAFLRQGVMLGCNDSKSYDWFLQLRELGIEVDE